eukprot:2180162-Pleurochrysis_carterae.AAC.2
MEHASPPWAGSSRRSLCGGGDGVAQLGGRLADDDPSRSRGSVARSRPRVPAEARARGQQGAMAAGMSGSIPDKTRLLMLICEYLLRAWLLVAPTFDALARPNLLRRKKNKTQIRRRRAATRPRRSWAPRRTLDSAPSSAAL